MAPGPHQLSEKDAVDEVDRLETMFDKNRDGRIDYNGKVYQSWKLDHEVEVVAYHSRFRGFLAAIFKLGGCAS